MPTFPASSTYNLLSTFILPFSTITSPAYTTKDIIVKNRAIAKTSFKVEAKEDLKMDFLFL